MFKHNSLIGFTMKAITVIIGLALVWTFIAPYYNRILITAADWPVTVYRLTSEAGGIFFYSSAGEPVTGIHGAALHFGLILLLSLLIATPGLKILHRLRNIGVGLVVIFIFHLVTLITLARLTQSGAGISGFTMPLILISTIGLNLLPVLVWVILSLRRLFARELQTQNTTSDELNSISLALTEDCP